MNEPARLPCADFPPDWAPGGRKGSPAYADVRKCLWVADRVLGRRHTKTAYTFAAALAVKVGGVVIARYIATYTVQCARLFQVGVVLGGTFCRGVGCSVGS